MVALGRGASPVDAVPLAGTPRAATALPESLVALADLPGARYVLAVDASGERVRGELGGPPESDLAVLSWARRLADVSRERGRAMEDVVLTTGTAFHLVRSVPGIGEDLWVVLRIDRERGNLALARRALAALGTRGPAGPRALSAGPTTSAAPSSGSFPAPRPVPPMSGSFPAPVAARQDGPVTGSFSGPGSGRPEGPVTGSFSGPGSGRPDGPVTGSFPAAMPSAGAPVPPAPRPAPDRDLPRRVPRSGAGVPALAFLPPSTPAARPGLAPEEIPPPPPVAVVLPPARVDGPVGAPDATNAPSTQAGDPGKSAAARVNGPVGAPDATNAPSTSAGEPEEPDQSASARVDGAVDAPDATEAPSTSADPRTPGMWDPRRRPLTIRQNRTWRTPPEVPAAREAAEPVVAPVPEIPAPRTGSLFAPVVVVPPPPSPVDDDTTEVPAPVPYPIITAPPLAPAPEPVASAPEPAPEEEQPASEVGLPRRVPGAHLRSPTPAPPPAPAAALATGIPGWSTEPSVLRRLLSGLRRLT